MEHINQDMTEKQEVSFIGDLWERRVPQFTATYIGVVWGITQFIAFITGRYNTSDHLVDKFLLFSAILLPSVILYIYNHGRPGTDPWRPFEKVLYPINLVLAIGAAALIGGGGGDQLNATPTEVQVTTEEGDTMTRLVPSLGQTKSFSLFPFINKGNEKDNWIKFAIPNLFVLDMEQDMRLYCLSPTSFDYEISSANHNIEDNDIPFRTYLKMARDNITDYFMIGEYTLDGDNLKLDINVYESKTGELFYTEQIETTDKIGIVDKISNKLMGNLFLKDNDNEETYRTDLPVGDLITNNEKALKEYTEARLSIINNDFDQATKKIDEAISIDKSSHEFRATKTTIQYFIDGQKQAAVNELEDLISQSDGLPERQKFRLKEQYYQYSDQVDKMLLLQKLWKDLYPQDFEPYKGLMDHYTLTANIGKSKAIGLEALENGHGARVLRDLASLCIRRQEFEEAEKYINEYYELFPDKNKNEDDLLPVIYMKQGKFEKAVESYESILLINPGDRKTIASLADLYTLKGDFAKAESGYNKALSKSNLYEDSTEIILKKMGFYLMTGECSKFNEEAETHYKLTLSNRGDMMARFSTLNLSSAYAMAGQKEKIRKIGKIVKEETPEHSTIYECVSEFLMSMVLGDKETLRKYNQGECRMLLETSTPNIGIIADALQAKLDDDHESAVNLFESYIDSTGQSTENLSTWLAEEYRLLGKYDEAIKHCNDNLKIKPGDPQLQLQLSKTKLAQGKTEEAKQVFEVVKKLYKNIEPEFVRYDDYKAYEEELAGQ